MVTPPWHRRDFLHWSSLAGISWLTPVSQLLALEAERAPQRPAQSIILLWLAGGPSQLETFDPHPGSRIAAGTRAIATSVRGVQLAAGYERLAEQMDSIALVRSVVSQEGDHERGTYMLKTGFRPDPTIVHPSIGAICAYELPVGRTEIPRHVSILPNRWPGRGGFLGDEYDAFQTWDPAQKVPDVAPLVPPDRDQRRVDDLKVVEEAFARGRQRRIDHSLHRQTIQAARTMMTSEQLKAFDVALEPASVRQRYGDNPFGRGCLAARRLIEVGVRCVEVTLDGWDSHVNNHAIHAERAAVLDPAFSALVADLKERRLFERTVVICMGEFGRTPTLNPAEGRDHWPKGFSVALAGGPLRGGTVLGATDPDGREPPAQPVAVADIHATVLAAVGIDPGRILQSKIGRTVPFSQGTPLPALLG
jgi:hypothetical protein